MSKKTQKSNSRSKAARKGWETRRANQKTKASYDATQDKKRRQPPKSLLRNEDEELKLNDRAKLLTAARDLRRNFTIAGWGIRKHLDYTTTFNFQAKTGNDELDSALEGLMAWWQLPENCDVTERFNLGRLIRMVEGCAVVDGDIFIVKLADGRLQVIEGDRCRSPHPKDLRNVEDIKKWKHGILQNSNGAARKYSFYKRKGNGFQFDRTVGNRFINHHFYIDRFDQVRGISPLAPAINNFRDLYECNDYALAKMKIAQLFGLSFYRESGEPMQGSNGDEAEGPTDYDIDFSKGPLVLDLDPGDKAEFLENKTPSQEFQSFSETTAGIALKCLNIPYSFYNESFTNYSGSRQAMIQYQKSANSDQDRNRRLLNDLTAWRIQLFILQDRLVLPAGMRFQDIRWEWVHAGVPWIDPLKEVNADVKAIEEDLTTTTAVIKMRTGKDFEDVIKEKRREDDIREKYGYPTSKETPKSQSTITINEITNA